MPKMSETQIVDLVKNKEAEEQKETIEKEIEDVKIPTTKEAIEAFNTLSRYIESAKSYNDAKLDLLQNMNDCIIEIRTEKIEQKNIFDFFKRV